MPSELLRIATAGSVDDGKSTLIGRLLHDTKSIFEDQLESIELTSQKRGNEQTDLALLTDGLRAEREQGITIDVAHRYFATPKRKFVIADTPGHIQYTRNMVTGASTANLALLLVDARKGVLEQTRRHALLSSLLRVPHLVLCVNKMDLVDYDQAIYDEIREEFKSFAAKLEITDLGFVPISALEGDNVVNRSLNMPWFDGQPLLGHLEDVHIASDRNLVDNRFPVQYVIRPQTEEHRDYRGFAGSVVGGIFKQGDEVMVLPSRRTSKIAQIDTPDGSVAQAFPPMAVTMLLEDELDVSRGDMICRPTNQPSANRRFEAMICWFDETSTLRTGAPYQLKHTSKWVAAEIEYLRYELNVDTLHRDLEAETLAVNDIGRVAIHTTSPLFFDEYRLNRNTGSFILVDPATDLTVAAGMIIGAGGEASTGTHSIVAENITFHPSKLSREDRWGALDTGGATIWMTGLSGSGKSTIATAIEHSLVSSGRSAYMLDGDNLRHGLNADLGFSEEDRAENVRRVGAVAKILAEAGTIAIASLVSPYAAERDKVRVAHEEAGIPFFEVFVDTPLEECERRDPKGLYAKARAGEITNLTGVGAPYEAPTQPDLVTDPDLETAVRQVLGLLG
ncbi:MAG: bifunctional enzyme CysN/CysC [Solirubrobacterales bacterium]|nr:bifunctional enzyme CysN/CysC [Solirubrobacterales bacterium]